MSAVQSPSRPKALRYQPIALFLLALMTFLAFAHAAEPRIDFISNIVNRSVVEIHFSTPAETSRRYFLQYINSMPCRTNQPFCSSNGVVMTNWSNLYTGFSFPFPYHYVVPDTRTNKNRFYRLFVTP